MDYTLGDLIGKYILLRDKANEIKAKHKEELVPYNTAMQKIEDRFQKVMQDQNLENLKTENGVAYRADRVSVTVADWDTFYAYVVENDAAYLLEKRASKAAAEEILEETGELPPGLNMNRSVKINVRRA